MNFKKVLVILVIIFLCTAFLIATIFGVLVYLKSRELEDRVNILTTQSQDSSNDQPQDSNENSNSSENSTINWQIVAETMNDETSVYSVDITYPKLQNYSDSSVEDTFNDFVFNEINKYARDVKFSDPGDAGVKNLVELSYETYYTNSRFISILITGNTYIGGGAHPTPVLIVINYDLMNNQELKLSDLFKSGTDYLNKISILTKEDLSNQLGDAFVASGASAVLDNFEFFNFSDTNLKVTFSAYQVGPYAAGTPSVEMPLNEFSTMLNADFQ